MNSITAQGRGEPFLSVVEQTHCREHPGDFEQGRAASLDITRELPQRCRIILTGQNTVLYGKETSVHFQQAGFPGRLETAECINRTQLLEHAFLSSVVFHGGMIPHRRIAVLIITFLKAREMIFNTISVLQETSS